MALDEHLMICGELIENCKECQFIIAIYEAELEKLKAEKKLGEVDY